MKESNNHYQGKLSPGGAKQIPALHPQKSGGNVKRIKGNDLRTGKGKK